MDAQTIETPLLERLYQQMQRVRRFDQRVSQARRGRVPRCHAVEFEYTLRGDASGERFRRKGKTDICVEVANRAAFVGECKTWGGPKVANDAIDQLLGYLTWRDCHAANV